MKYLKKRLLNSGFRRRQIKNDILNRRIKLRYITAEEQKKIMLDMLKYIDEICRNNNIKYSLLAGTLIGAVRHHGFIPWDDDVDIVLTRSNYNKLKMILDCENGRYQTLKYKDGGRRFMFTKLIDTKTGALEPMQQKYEPMYGVFIDIFCYRPTAMDDFERERHYNKIVFLKKMIGRGSLDFKNRSIKGNVVQFGYNFASMLIGYKRLHKRINKTLDAYSDSEYLVSNWPLYGYAKEIQLKKNTEDYIDAKFENLTVMIFKNYDDILRTTYGDYMKLPPKKERVPKHNMVVWWKREGDDGQIKK